MKGYQLPGRRLVSQDDAAIIESPNIPRSKFTGSWTRKMTFDQGYLVPFLVEEILPGDHMNYNVTAYIRLSTPLFPLFDNQRIDTFFFFVPNRLVWGSWTKMMGEQQHPGSSIAYTMPTLASTVGGYAAGTIYDHMGLPTAGQVEPTSQVTHQVLPLRMYNMIWNEWFRDENVDLSVIINTGDSGDAVGNYTLLRRRKAHDYFTSALPWPQKFTAPTIPLLGTAPITGLGVSDSVTFAGPVNSYETSGTNPHSYANYKPVGDVLSTSRRLYVNMDNVSGLPLMFADLTQATGVAINQLRQAWMIQSLLERDARGGTRYVELIRSHFGVINPDFRLQRPEYIGGGQTPLSLTPIAQTAPTTGVPLGALGAAGTAAGTHTASYAATEHGYIIGLINVRSELSYQQGLRKHWSRSTRYDFYWPALAGLGEQAILTQEIYCTGYTGAGQTDTVVFGYQERWQEYRTRSSEVTGMFKSTTTGTIDAWHTAQKFTSAPVLNSAFLEDNAPMARVLAAGSLAANMQYLADILIDRTAVRPIPAYGTPVQLGRF